jgi:hypothetical protein
MATDDALNCSASDLTCKGLQNIFTGIANDCCTTGGGTKSFNSLLIPIFNLQTWFQPAGTLCDGEPGHQILPPVSADGSSVWKAGRTVPLKFRVCNGNGVSVGAIGTVTAFELLTITGSTATVVDQFLDTTIPDAGFRFDPTAQQWIMNYSTQGLAAGKTYAYRIGLADGTSIFFQFGLR